MKRSDSEPSETPGSDTNYSTSCKPHHLIKRPRGDSTGSRSVDTSETLRNVEYVKKITLLEMRNTKLNEDNQKLKIEAEFKNQERKNSSLREDAKDKTAKDRAFSQRNALFDKNTDLSEELDSLSETYRSFHSDMSEKNNKLLGEVGELNMKLMELTEELYSEKKKRAQETILTTQKLSQEIAEKEYDILRLQNENTVKDMTISTMKSDLDSINTRLVEFSDIKKSEIQLRMELDSLKNREIYAKVFPEKILKSTQVQEENLRLQRDIQNLREEKEFKRLLKIQLEDAQKEICALKQRLSEYHTLRNEHELLSESLKEWLAVQSEMSSSAGLNMGSPRALISMVTNLQSDNLQMTSLIEQLRTEVVTLSADLSEEQEGHAAIQSRAAAEQEKVSKLKKKTGLLEARCTEFREEARSCRELLETYQATTESDRAKLPRVPGPKILHMKCNPYQTKLDGELKRLSEENAQLRKQIEQSDSAGLVRELDHYQQKLSETDTTLKKTRTIYQAKVKEFKQGIFDMFGYTVTCPTEDQFSLLSVFAESQEDKIIFYRVQDNLQLIQNNYMTTLEMLSHISKLQQHRSIPLFLADVTSDLFHRQTVNIGEDLEYTCTFGGINKL